MNLEDLLACAQRELAGLHTPEQVESFRIKYLGAKGWFKQAADHLRTLEPSLKRDYGRRLNEAKQVVQRGYEQAKAAAAAQPAADAAAFDITEPGRLRFDHYRPGTWHPIHQTIDTLTELFARQGFARVEGPELEDDFHNFEALNVPPQHPARDPLENFYLDRPAGAPPYMLRSQTSSVQIRVMEKQRPPIRIIAPGRVYRPDTVDATHCWMFHQLEGLCVERGVSMVDLKTSLHQFARAFFGPDVPTRFRPSFFPFTEPSAEFDVLFTQPDGSTRWVELGGCGMVHPKVLEKVNIDPDTYTGFAFGLGIERLAMRRHGIDDIRVFFENDVRFLRQF